MKSKLLTLLLSAAIAFGLWMYVVTVVDPESESPYYDVPVVFDGLSVLSDRNLMIISGNTATVDLRLLGNRTDLNKLDKTNITILADLSRITEPGEHSVKYSISYPSSAGAIEVLEQDPQYITVHVSRRLTKEVPVDVRYTGALKQNFVADVQNPALDHATVTVTGPQEIVDQIHSAAIEVDLTGRSDNIVETYRHTLCDEDGNPIEDVSAVTVNVSDIRVTVRVWQIKEIPIVIQVVDGGGLTAEDITATPNHTSILVSGSEAALEGFDQIELVIELNHLTASGTLPFKIELPQNVNNESGISEILVDVKVPEMTKKVIFVSQERFVMINVPENMQADIWKGQLLVTVRGRENKLQDVTEDNIMVYIDFSKAFPGTSYYNCTIEIIGVEDVGVVYDESTENQYRVLATVTLLTPEPEA
jgi:YbbR domain-containing protein